MPLKATLRLAPGTIFFSWLIFLSRKMPWPCDLLLGLTIHVVLGFFWNSSKKMAYSSGWLE
jgi:hypothetical protein